MQLEPDGPPEDAGDTWDSASSELAVPAAPSGSESESDSDSSREALPVDAPAPAALRSTAKVASGSNPLDTPGRDSGSGDWDATPPPEFKIGEVVFGKYEVLAELGHGGMGAVWKVRNLDFDVNRALKTILPKFARNAQGWRRFKREAQLMDKLHHENAVAVYGFKRDQSMAYIEMEYVRGRNIAEILKERNGQPMPLKWIVPVLDQLCSVLQMAHDHHDEDTGKPKPIIHRDLKPSNLMIVDRKPEGHNLKVLDFGIAKMIDEDEVPDAHITIPGEFLGTLHYCSPEQINSGLEKAGKQAARPVDARSDLYSTGIILYELLTGKLPFDKSLPAAAILAAHLQNTPPPMREANPRAKVPPAVERLVMQCLEKDPNRRPRSAQELAERFRDAAGVLKPGGGPSGVKRLALSASASAVVMALALVLYVTVIRPGPTPDASSSGNGTSHGNGKGTLKGGPSTGPGDETKPTVLLWEPRGYKAVGSKLVPGSARSPMRLRREFDKVEFAYYKDGVYLPDGYEPEDPAATVGPWPKVLVRAGEGGKAVKNPVRFLRIEGGVYRRGDVRKGAAQNALTPHWVKVGSFYMQETEVTNAEVDDYLARFDEEKHLWEGWREAKRNVAGKTNADRMPALGVTYRAARRFARSVSGRLPSEAEWEYAAKSGHAEYLWAWGVETPPGGHQPWAKLFNSLAPYPGPVKSFEKDRNAQGVFDLTGSASEWCADQYRAYDEMMIPADNDEEKPLVDNPWRDTSADPGALDATRPFVLRGGSHLKRLNEAMVFKRDAAKCDDFSQDYGFRVVIECPPGPDDRAIAE